MRENEKGALMISSFALTKCKRCCESVKTSVAFSKEMNGKDDDDEVRIIQTITITTMIHTISLKYAPTVLFSYPVASSY